MAVRHKSKRNRRGPGNHCHPGGGYSRSSRPQKIEEPKKTEEPMNVVKSAAARMDELLKKSTNENLTARELEEFGTLFYGGKPKE